ncbi:sulfotransferase family 2 domain-containing protein [Mesorhizobium sp. 10J20-29]
MLSHHHRTIFIHIPKCAGQSVELAYLKDLGMSWETRALLLLRANDQPERGPPRLAHLLAGDYVRFGHLTQEAFDAYFRFAVVRNPWSRAVSLYRHLNLNMPFRSFVLDWLPQQFAHRGWGGSFWFVRPQSNFVMEDGRLLCHEVLRFETLAEDFSRVAAASNLVSDLPHANRSGSRMPVRPRSLLRRCQARLVRDRRDRFENWNDFYDEDTVVEVGRLYATDAKEFGYERPASGTSRR